MSPGEPSGPTSTRVPTIERTIWWQNALAVISNRRRSVVAELGATGAEDPPGHRAMARAALGALGPPAERREVVLADQRVAGRCIAHRVERRAARATPVAEQRVRHRLVPRRRSGSAASAARTGRRTPASAHAELAHGDGRRAHLVEPPREVVEVGGRRAGRGSPPDPSRARRHRCGRRRSGCDGLAHHRLDGGSQRRHHGGHPGFGEAVEPGAEVGDRDPGSTRHGRQPRTTPGPAPRARVQPRRRAAPRPGSTTARRTRPPRDR